MTQKELKNTAPKLSEIKSTNTGFTAPEGYFNSIEDVILKKITQKNYSKAQSVPEGYFDSIEDRVFEQIQEKTKIIKLPNNIVKFIVPIAIAASILLLITLRIFDSNQQQDLFAKIEISEIETWIENGELNIDTFEITSIYDDVNYNEISLIDFYTENDLINYLDNYDIESLILTN